VNIVRLVTVASPYVLHWDNGFRVLAQGVFSQVRATNAVSGWIRQVSPRKSFWQQIADRRIGKADGRALRYHTDNPDVLQSYIRNAAENPKPPRKRKRRSAPSQMQSAAEPSHTGSYSHVDSPQAISPGTDLDTLLQVQIAREQSSGQHDVIHTEKKLYQPHNPSQPNVARARGPVIGATSSLYSSEARKSTTDASSSRDPAPLPTERHRPVLHALAEENKSATPGSAVLQERFEKKILSTPVIDTLPKAKHRQIFSILVGLQGGIDHLQKQLDALKALLGIDDDDEDETEPH
jgi:hypothetical protein